MGVASNDDEQKHLQIDGCTINSPSMPSSWKNSIGGGGSSNPTDLIKK